MKVKIIKQENEIITSACMPVTQHRITHLTQEKALNQIIIQICGSYIC